MARICLFYLAKKWCFFRVNNNLAKRSSKIVKRTFDILGSSFLLLLLLPFCIPLYFIITRDGGNFIYEHPRIGQHKKEIQMFEVSNNGE